MVYALSPAPSGVGVDSAAPVSYTRAELGALAASIPSMFDAFRRSLENLVNGSVSPEARREELSRMKDTLVQARLGVEDLRGGVAQTRTRLAAERRELDTVRRRKGLADGIGDRETVSVAERFERHYAERVEVLERKLAAQEGELAVVEREVAEMTEELRRAVAGISPPGGGAASGSVRGGAAATGGAGSSGPADPLGDDSAATREAIDALERERRRAERDAAAEERLAALKRKMGK
jgi:phage shock protein A